MQFTTLETSIYQTIAHIELDRPAQANAINEIMWQEIQTAMKWADQESTIRVIIISGKGAHFCAGIDLQMLKNIQSIIHHECGGRMRENLRQYLLSLQGSLTAIENCRKPVLAAIHGACIGAGLDLIAACDLRYCSAQAIFAIKEIDMGIVADVGTLQRLPKLINAGIVSELAYTGRKLAGTEAQQIGLVNRCYENAESMMVEVKQIAQVITQKSPLAIRGTKEILRYSRDHSVSDSLNYVATWNAAMLLSNDLAESLQAFSEKKEPVFHD